jgi:16S rRNA (guanine966-N2)-methyltransferase
MRSRIINFPDAAGLRPTPDRVRETLFNWLGQTLHGRSCLDLFAGSGALGFEAASRGAELVVMVEKTPLVFQALRDNISRLGLSRVSTYCQDGLEFVARDTRRYDVIFLDPPFSSDYLPRLLDMMPRLLSDDGLLYVESGAEIDVPAPWERVRTGRTKQVNYQLLRIGQDDLSGSES